MSQMAGRATVWLSDVVQISRHQLSVFGGSVASAQRGEVAAATKSQGEIRLMSARPNLLIMLVLWGHLFFQTTTEKKKQGPYNEIVEYQHDLALPYIGELTNNRNCCSKIWRLAGKVRSLVLRDSALWILSYGLPKPLLEGHYFHKQQWDFLTSISLKHHGKIVLGECASRMSSRLSLLGSPLHSVLGAILPQVH